MNPLQLRSRISLLLLLLFLPAGCLFDDEIQCRLSTECPDGLFCHMGYCADLGQARPGGGPLLAGPGDSEEDPFDWDHELDGPEEFEEEEPEPHPCPDAPPASAHNLVLNEVLAYVPTGPEGDANGDGVRHAHDDEFVELVNPSEDVIDLTNVIIRNDATDRFTFPPFCLEPLHAVVVFGGIEPGAELPSGEGWQSFVADTRFAYANGAGRVVVVDASGEPIADFTYGAHPAVSLNRAEDIRGADFVPHSELNEDAIFSPGTCADGRPFTTGCLP